MADAVVPRTGTKDHSAVFDNTTELGRDYTAVDWSATQLGPVHTWSASLKNTVRLMISSRFSMWMAWGPDLVFFCNDAYRRDTLAGKYPWALGRRADEVWAEIWPDIGPRIDSVMSTGVATWDAGLLLFLERSGYVEETYHTFSYSPLTDDDGLIAGMLCVVSEDTGRVVSERRISTLRDLGTGLASANTETEVHAAAQGQLATDPYNLPFVVVYLLDGEVARRAWTVGIDAGHPAAPESLEPTSPWSGAADGGRHVVELSGVFDDLPTGAWSEPPRQALTVPLRHSADAEHGGFLIIGLNRHRPLDEDYRGFLDLLAGQLSAAVTRARAFETERTRAEQMAELNRAKTTFFTNVSHELRTPLTLLLGPCEDALADAGLDAVQRGRIEVVHRNAERLLKLVNTLLDFSRLESGRLQARYEPVDIARYTAELASMFESATHRAGLHLNVACEPQQEAFYVDREMWAKIVLNLLSNALKATFQGGITVRLEAADGEAQLRVTDTGIGIPPQEQQRLFERFHRVSGAALRTHEGSGIGLALVAELAGVHGGRVGVESEVDLGTTFTIYLPAGTAHLPTESVVATTADGPSAGSYGAGYLAEALRWVESERSDDATGPPAGADGRHLVLVVDDNADMREYVSALLGDEYRTLTAADGAIALDLAIRTTPDLILTDVMMPNLDGFGLLAALRADPATMHIPVVMLSARSGDEATAEGLERGADDYLVKPFTARELLARVHANLELDRVRRLVEELERNRAMLAKAEEMAVVGSYEYDIANDRLVGSNQFHLLLGTTPESVAENGFAGTLRVIHPDDAAGASAAVERTLTKGEPLAIEYRVVDPDGRERIIWSTGAVDHGADGTPTRLRGSVQDITDRRRAEEASAAAAAAREAEARERAIAVELQRSLLPARSFDADHLDVATFYQAGVQGTEVGGDWYDVIDLDAGRTALVLGDVMGRGVQAAAVMGQLRATVRAYARLDVAPDLLLHLLDSAVREISEDTIVTCVYAMYDPDGRRLVYANAGHLPPLLTTAGEGTTRLTCGGPPLGTGRTWAEPETLVLPPGAVLTLYTDGLVEDRGTSIDVGIDALAALLAAVDGPIDNRPAQLVDVLRPHGTDDDVAVLMAAVSRRSGLDRSAVHSFEPDTDIARAARDFAGEQLAEWDVPDAVVFDVQLVVSELATNALRHGRPPIQVGIRRSGDRVFVNVDDSAAAPPRMRHPGSTDIGGRGLLIVSSIAERWGTRQTDSGKSVWAVIRMPAA